MSEKNSYQQIARAALAIKAIKLSINLALINLFTWAKGWKTPIYNDNRLHLSYTKNRALIVKAIEEKVEEKNLKFDGILGTTSSGIAWAILLGIKLGKPVYILDKGKVRRPHFPGQLAIEAYKNKKIEAYDLVASNSPSGICAGIRIANHFNKGFIYVRKQKDHGLMNEIEGAYTKGQTVYYVDSRHDSAMIGENMEILTKSGLRATYGKEGNMLLCVEVSIQGMTLIGIEDIISTGGSSLDEAKQARALGAIVTDIITIFNYRFPVAEKKAKDAGVTIHNLLDYDQLLTEAVTDGYIQSEELEILKEWRKNPIEWSDKYGNTNFTKIETPAEK